MAIVTTLLFDFGATLDGPDYWLDRFAAQYRKAEIPIAREALDPAYQHASVATVHAGRVVERFGFIDLVRMLVGQQVEFLTARGADPVRAMLGALDSRARHRLTERITALFVEESTRGMKRSRAVLATLKPRYRIAVVSNWYGNLKRVLAEAAMSPFIDTVVDSGRLGFEKPDPRMFQTALESLGTAPASAAMIGDSLEKDCAPARALGLKTVWYRPDPAAANGNSSGDARGGESISADHIIAALEELATLEI
ncbi:MAG TPA: HAD family hydrolase [Candidatus Binataceae bacterium]|nr:HAD family hydrolase [Candidatus Binataceae bacterium]